MVNVCKHCQKQYIAPAKGYCCDACKKIDEELYEKIRTYLKSFPNSNALQISEALAVKPSVILKYVDEGMLVVGKGEFEQI